MGSLQEELDAAIEQAEKEVKARYERANRQREVWRRQMRQVLMWLLVFFVLFAAAYIASQ